MTEMYQLDVASAATSASLEKTHPGGKYVRKASEFMHFVGTDRFPAEAGRYHLYVSMACPWAAGVLSALYLKGLEKVISVSVVHPTWQRTRPDDPNDKHNGWVFRNPGDAPLSNALGFGKFDCDDACVPDPVFGAETLRDVYEAGGAKLFKFSTPLLLDKKTKTIVNNESSQLLRMFNSAFNDFAEHPEVDLFPEAQEAALESFNDFIYPDINDGVYKCGFAKSQEAYEEAMVALFAALDRVEAHLATSRYLTDAPQGLTWIDLRLYHTLVRFDPVYHTYFHTNLKRIEADYPNLLGFVRDVWQTFEGVRRATNIKHFVEHYYSSHPVLNTYAIVPMSRGPDLTVPHGRAPNVDAPTTLQGHDAADTTVVTTASAKDVQLPRGSLGAATPGSAAGDAVPQADVGAGAA